MRYVRFEAQVTAFVTLSGVSRHLVATLHHVHSHTLLFFYCKVYVNRHDGSKKRGLLAWELLALGMRQGVEVFPRRALRCCARSHKVLSLLRVGLGAYASATSATRSSGHRATRRKAGATRVRSRGDFDGTAACPPRGLRSACGGGRQQRPGLVDHAQRDQGAAARDRATAGRTAAASSRDGSQLDLGKTKWAASPQQSGSRDAQLAPPSGGSSSTSSAERFTGAVVRRQPATLFVADPSYPCARA